VCERTFTLRSEIEGERTREGERKSVCARERVCMCMCMCMRMCVCVCACDLSAACCRYKWYLINDPMCTKSVASSCSTCNGYRSRRYTATHCNKLQHTATRCQNLNFVGSSCSTFNGCCRSWLCNKVPQNCNRLQQTATDLKAVCLKLTLDLQRLLFAVQIHYKRLQQTA